MVRITGLEEFGSYLCKLMVIDALFLNEDRHTHNIAVLLDSEGQYRYCPIFDHGGCLLSDTTLDYPLGVEIEALIKNVEAKTLAEALTSNWTQLKSCMEKRVFDILCIQKRKYQYLFKK